MTNEVAKVKAIMKVELKVHQKDIEYYMKMLDETTEEKVREYLQRALYTEKVRLKEVEYLIHEMEAGGLWE